jgi:hypothetical protein
MRLCVLDHEKPPISLTAGAAKCLAPHDESPAPEGVPDFHHHEVSWVGRGG